MPLISQGTLDEIQHKARTDAPLYGFTDDVQIGEVQRITQIASLKLSPELPTVTGALYAIMLTEDEKSIELQYIVDSRTKEIYSYTS